MRNERRGSRRRWFIDFHQVEGLGRVRLYSIPQLGQFESRDDARAVLEHVRGEVFKGLALPEVLARYLPATAKPNLVQTRLEEWLRRKRRQCAAGDLSPTYLRELDRWARREGHFGWWWGRSIHEIDARHLDDFAAWLETRPKHSRQAEPSGELLASNTRRRILGGFRSFVGWLVDDREELLRVPRFPRVRAEEHAPTIISAGAQDAILKAIPEDERGVFLAMAFSGVRPGEARALNVEDYRDGWLAVGHAMKGSTHKAPRLGPKTRQARRVPVHPELVAWIEERWPARERLASFGSALFPFPRARHGSGRWTWHTLDRAWKRACTSVGVEVRMYEGTKHAMATDAIARGVDERRVQELLGHRDIRSTRRYARLGAEALVDVLRVPSVSPADDAPSHEVKSDEDAGT